MEILKFQLFDRIFKLKSKLQAVFNKAKSDCFDVAMSSGLLPQMAVASLALPETQKIIEKRGYTGIKAYLYTGCVELGKLLLMSPKHFAALHDNFETFQYEKRVQRIRIVKITVFSLAMASALAVSLFLPPAAGLIPVIIKSGILILFAVFSAAFFGIIIHALNNFIEDMRFKAIKITFTAFTAKGLEDKLNDYINSKDIDLESDVKFLLDNKKQIDLLFKKPEAFKNGTELKLRLQNLIEVYYLKAIESNNAGVQDSLSSLIYGFYAVIDSLALQEALVFGYEKTGKADITDIQYEILKFFSVSNAIAFRNNYDKANIIYRINNQRRMMRLFFSGDKLEYIKKLDSEIESDIQNIIFMNAKLEFFHSVSESDLMQRLDAGQMQKMTIALKAASKITYLFEDIQRFRISKQIGYMYIKTIKNKNVLQNILSGKILAEYRLHALLRLSTMEESPFSVNARLTRLIKIRVGFKEEKIAISKDIESELYKESVKILDNASKNKLSTGDIYFDALEAEMLFTAAAVLLHEKYPDVDIVEFLSQLKFTFVRDGSTEFIVNYSGSDESEHVRIAMDNNKGYIDSIKDFVESVYKRNMGVKTDVNNAKFKTVAKGRSALIMAVPR
ncbi:MAG: hypothetical protein LBS42_10965 [Tannerella sp.]|jgi:hypothetical protein|nr:hypothetical protein [Tannerella sp.]